MASRSASSTSGCPEAVARARSPKVDGAGRSPLGNGVASRSCGGHGQRRSRPLLDSAGSGHPGRRGQRHDLRDDPRRGAPAPPLRPLPRSAGRPAGSTASTIVESAPVPDDEGRRYRGVVAEGAVGSRLLGRFRVFRYEVRRWPGGSIPDLAHAVASPVRITDDDELVRRSLETLAAVPAPVWGRDELRTGDMWNSNSVVSWMLTSAGLIGAAGSPPPGGRAPGWDAGVRAAERAASAIAMRGRTGGYG